MQEQLTKEMPNPKNLSGASRTSRSIGRYPMIHLKFWRTLSSLHPPYEKGCTVWVRRVMSHSSRENKGVFVLFSFVGGTHT